MNRLIGLWWLAKILYPELFPEDLRALTPRFLHALLSRDAERRADRPRAGGTGLTRCAAAVLHRPIDRAACRSPGLADRARRAARRACIVAFTVGRYPVALARAVRRARGRGSPAARSSAPPAVENVILLVRGPRVVAAVLVGAALAVAGTAFQGLFRNPLVSPDILGASSGAALGAVIGIYFSLGVIGIEALAFAGGLVAVAAVYLIGSLLQSRDPILVLVLTGVVIGSLLGAGVGLVKYLADPYNQLPAMTFWLLGSLAATTVVRSAAAARPGRARHRRAGRAALAHERDVAAGGGSARARRRHRPAAHRHRGGGDAGDLGERRDLRHHRLGRPGGAASRARAGRAGFPAAAADRGAARRRLSAVHRHAGAHRGAGRNPARHPHRRDRHAVLHLAARRHADGTGHDARAARDLTIGYRDRVVGTRARRARSQQGEVLALLGPNGGGKTTLLKTLLGILPPLGRRGRDRRPLARRRYSIRERARAHRLCAAGAHADLRIHGRDRGADGPHRAWQPVQPAVGARPRRGGARARALRHRASRASAPTP